MKRIMYLVWGMLIAASLHAQTNPSCNTQSFFRTFGDDGNVETGLTLCAAGDGNLYASGVKNNKTLLLKLTPDGDVLWSRSFTLDSVIPCIINEMVVDDAGMLVAAGIQADSQQINSTSLVFRYDPVDNTMLWVKRFEEDTVYANGIIEKSPGGNYIFYQNTISIGTLSARAEVLELDRLTGNVVPTFTRSFSLNNAAEFTRIVSYEGALYGLGTAQTLPIPIPSFRPLLTRFSSTDGQPVWSTLTYISTTPTDLLGLDLLIDNDTILSLTGGAFLGLGIPGPVHLYLQKNTLNGDLIWMKKYEIPGFNNEVGSEIVKLDDGYAIYGAGELDTVLSQMVLKLDHDGNVISAKKLGTTDQSGLFPFLKGEAIAFDNHLYFTGAVSAGDFIDWSIYKADSALTLLDSCAFLQTLDAVTAVISPNPQSISTTLQSTSGVSTATDTTLTVINTDLPSQLLCSSCQDSCNFTLDLGPDRIFCNDTTITLSAGPGFVSYLWSDSSTTSSITVVLDTMSVSVSVTVVDSCGNTQRDTINFTVLSDVVSIADQTLCQGDSITLTFPQLAGFEFLSDTTLAFDSLGTIVLSPDTTTAYTLFVSTVDGCAKLDTFLISVSTQIETSDTLTACVGDFILLDGNTYTQNAIIIDTLQNAVGCDTVRTRQLLFNALPVISDTIILCAGDTIIIDSVTYTQSTTIIQDTLASTGAGCDTLMETILVFNPTGSATVTLQLCANETITIGGNVYSQSGTVVDTLTTTPGGCDSVVTYVLTFIPLPTLTDTIKFAVGDTVFVNGVPFTVPTIVVDTLPSTTMGCDTIATYVLQYLLPFVIICQPDITVTAPFGDSTTIVDYDLPMVISGGGCPGGTPTFTLLSGFPVGGSFPIGVTEVCILATDSCGNTDTCCFNVTVIGDQKPCDVKTNGCFRWELQPIKLDSLGQRRYQIKIVNNCAQNINYVLFQLPNGVVAVSPADGSTYTDPVSGRKYIVRNPNFSPFYSIRFKADVGTVLNNGVFDVLEFTLPQQAQPQYIHTLVKFADGTTLEAFLNTFNCPLLPFPNFAQNPLEERGLLTGQDLSLYPNPTNGTLLFDLAAWENQAVQVEVLNAQGRLVQTTKVTAVAGLQTMNLDGGLPNGLYHLVIRPNEGVPVAEPFILERN